MKLASSEARKRADVRNLAGLPRTPDGLEGIDGVVEVLKAAEGLGVRVVDRRVGPSRPDHVAAGVPCLT
jgi:hypothetical protein